MFMNRNVCSKSDKGDKTSTHGSPDYFFEIRKFKFKAGKEK